MSKGRLVLSSYVISSLIFQKLLVANMELKFHCSGKAFRLLDQNIFHAETFAIKIVIDLMQEASLHRTRIYIYQSESLAKKRKFHLFRAPGDVGNDITQKTFLYQEANRPNRILKNSKNQQKRVLNPGCCQRCQRLLASSDVL